MHHYLLLQKGGGGADLSFQTKVKLWTVRWCRLQAAWDKSHHSLRQGTHATVSDILYNPEIASKFIKIIGVFLSQPTEMNIGSKYIN